MFRVYVIHFIKENLSIIKYGITSKDILDRIKRTHLPRYNNGVPMDEYFDDYHIIYDSGLVFTREEAEAVEEMCNRVKKRDFFTPRGKQNHVDGISEMRYYSSELEHNYISVIEKGITLYAK